jgi:hypothetical protein
MMRPYEIGGKSSREPPFTFLLGVLAIIYLIIKVIGFFEGRTYYSPRKKSRILYHFYKTMQSAGMQYMEDARLYSSAKTVLILHVPGLRRSSSPSLTARLVAIHPERVVRHSMRALVYLKTLSKRWAGGLPKLGRYTFVITLPYGPNYNSPLSGFAFVVNRCLPVFLSWLLALISYTASIPLTQHHQLIIAD